MIGEILSAVKSEIVAETTKKISEVVTKEIGEVKSHLDPLEYTMNDIKNKSLESLKIENQLDAEKLNATKSESALSEVEREQIKAETGWSNEIIESIRTKEEAEIYKNVNLQEMEVNGRKVLAKSDIDWEQKDSMGRTNLGRAESGLSPINREGEPIELHHIGQKENGPLAELTPEEHRGKENYSTLHTAAKESEIDREKFGIERMEYWRKRASLIES